MCFVQDKNAQCIYIYMYRKTKWDNFLCIFIYQLCVYLLKCLNRKELWHHYVNKCTVKMKKKDMKSLPGVALYNIIMN